MVEQPTSFKTAVRFINGQKQLEVHNARLAEEARERLRKLGIVVRPPHDAIGAVRVYLETKGEPEGYQTMKRDGLEVTLTQIPGRKQQDPLIEIIDYTAMRNGEEYFGTRVTVADPVTGRALVLSSAHIGADIFIEDGKWEKNRRPDKTVQRIEKLVKPAYLRETTITTFAGEGEPDPQEPAPTRRIPDFLRIVE